MGGIAVILSFILYRLRDGLIERGDVMQGRWDEIEWVDVGLALGVAVLLLIVMWG